MRVSIIWVILNIAVGLLPVGTVMTFSSISDGQLLVNDYIDLIKDGTVMFVCIGMVYAAWIDFYLSKVQVNEDISRLALNLYPAICAFTIILKFIVVRLSKSRYVSMKEVLFDVNSELDFAIISLSLLYIIIVKSYTCRKGNSSI